MRRQRIQYILLLLLFLKSKVIVIDDVGATKEFGPDKKKLVDKVRKKINIGNEEVVIYGKNKRNRNVRISSNELDSNVKKKREQELKDKLTKLNNQKIINSLKKLVNKGIKPSEKHHKSNFKWLNDLQKNKTNYRDTNRNHPKTIYNRRPKIEIDEPIIEELPLKYPEEPVQPHNIFYKELFSDTLSPKKSLFDFDSMNDFSSLFKTRKDDIDNFLTNNFHVPHNEHLSNISTKNDEDLYKLADNNPNSYNNNGYDKDIPDYDHQAHENSISRDNISLLKNQEKENLLRAINNRKEYLRIKIDEVHNKKENIARQLGDYKKKIEDIYNRINKTRNIRDKLYTKINMEKSHISNLTQNSKEIQDKEGKLKDLIRMTRNEIIKYKSLLENEMAKLEVLEKQYEVYDNTLKRYNDDSNQESNNLVKLKNDLLKHENDLKDLNDIFSTYKCKHNDLNEELNRQVKIESDLEIENNKIERNGLSDMI